MKCQRSGQGGLGAGERELLHARRLYGDITLQLEKLGSWRKVGTRWLFTHVSFAILWGEDNV